MLTLFVFAVAALATVVTGHSPLAGLLAGLLGVAARHGLPRVVPRAVGFANQRRREPRRSTSSPAAGQARGRARRWRSIPMVGRVIIVTVAALVFAVAGVACATSYDAVLLLIGMLGLYRSAITRIFPLMLETAFIGCELAAILFTILRALHLRRLRFPAGMDPDDQADALAEARRQVSRGWPGWTMLVCGLATMAFNIGHAWLLAAPVSSPTSGLRPVSGTELLVWRCVVAAFPPAVMMLFFQVLIAVVKNTMVTIGRPLGSGAEMAPAMIAGYAPGMPAPGWSAEQMPSWAPSEMPQTGHADGVAGVLEPGAKRRAVESYLAHQTSQDLLRLNGERVAQDVQEEHGIQVSKRYAESLLEEARSRSDQAAMQGRNGGRRR